MAAVGHDRLAAATHPLQAPKRNVSFFKIAIDGSADADIRIETASAKGEFDSWNVSHTLALHAAILRVPRLQLRALVSFAFDAGRTLSMRVIIGSLFGDSYSG